MRPDPEIIDVPDSLKKLFKKKPERHYYYTKNRYAHLERRGEWLYIWAWDVTGEPEFVLLVVVNIDTKSWHSWDGEKWGKKKINPGTGWYSDTVTYDSDLDVKLLGESIEDIQDRQRQKKAELRYKKIKDDIERMLKNTRPIPKYISEWMHREMIHYIVFDTKDRKTGYCTYCEDFLTFPDKLVNGKISRCPRCGKKRDVRSTGKIPRETTRCFQFFQKCRDGLMLRIVEQTRKDQYINFFSYDGVTTEQGEYSRCLIDKDGVQHWYEKRNYWDDAWLINKNSKWVKHYNSPFRQYDEMPHDQSKLPATYGSPKKWVHFFKETEYAADEIEAFIDKLTTPPGPMDEAWYDYSYYYRVRNMEWGIYYMADIITTFKKMPQVESLLKLHFDFMVEEILERPGKRLDRNAGELHKFLKIKKETFRELMKLSVREREEFSLSDLDLLRKYEDTKLRYDEYIPYLDRYGSDIVTLSNTAEQYGLKFRKSLKYVSSHGTVHEWRDYIHMLSRMGILVSADNAYPQDLRRAHDELVREEEELELQEKIKKSKVKEEAFAKNQKKWKKFKLTENDLFIRPAENVAEIIREGRDQHNCVGSAGYIEKMIKGTTCILFLRFKDKPDESYYTVEMSPKGELKQAYAKYNKKTEDYDTVIHPMLMKLKEKINAKRNAG